MSTTLKWGLITGMVYIFYYLIIFMTGIQEKMMSMIMVNVALGLAITIATFFTIYLGVKEERNEAWNGYATLAQAFILGFKIALIGSVIAGVFTLIYNTVIDPGYAERIMAATQEQMENMGVEIDEDVLEKQSNSIMKNPFVAGAITIGWHAFVGTLKALVAGLLLKKDAPPSLYSESVSQP